MRYKILDQNGLNFLTLTIVEWIDLFTRPVYSDIVIESLRYCQKEKGLMAFGYVIMPSHLHLIVRTDNTTGLSLLSHNVLLATTSCCKRTKVADSRPRYKVQLKIKLGEDSVRAACSKTRMFVRFLKTATWHSCRLWRLKQVNSGKEIMSFTASKHQPKVTNQTDNRLLAVASTLVPP